MTFARRLTLCSWLLVSVMSCAESSSGGGRRSATSEPTDDGLDAARAPVGGGFEGGISEASAFDAGAGMAGARASDAGLGMAADASAGGRSADDGAASGARDGSGLDGSTPDGGMSSLGADAASDAGSAANNVPCAGPCPATNIKYLVVIVQENHTFDDHFGRYCTAAVGSNPSCTEGPACCEAAPATDPTGAPFVDSEDALHGMSAHDPDHTMACELSEMNGGKMDRYATGAQCSSLDNVARANPQVIQPLWDLAKRGALADRWFQPLAGQSSANDIYFARAQYGFSDNAFAPQGAVGAGCPLGATSGVLTGTTIADLLQGAGVPWAFYAEGYDRALLADQRGTCAAAIPGCPLGLPVYPCIYDPSDNPFQYFVSSQDKPESSRDFGRFADDLASGDLPAVSFVKAIGYRSEHPGYGTRLGDGIKFVTDVVAAVEESAYAPATLIVVAYDEGGGYFDHVEPPADNPVDHKPYGTRTPTLVLGPFAKKNHVSHVVMEHSSLVRFIEWNWLGKQTGQLAGRDGNVANLGSLLEAATTGVSVPE
jgi:phospholipase C